MFSDIFFTLTRPTKLAHRIGTMPNTANISPDSFIEAIMTTTQRKGPLNEMGHMVQCHFD